MNALFEHIGNFVIHSTEPFFLIKSGTKHNMHVNTHVHKHVTTIIIQLQQQNNYVARNNKMLQCSCTQLTSYRYKYINRLTGIFYTINSICTRYHSSLFHSYINCLPYFCTIQTSSSTPPSKFTISNWSRCE